MQSSVIFVKPQKESLPNWECCTRRRPPGLEAQNLGAILRGPGRAALPRSRKRHPAVPIIAVGSGADFIKRNRMGLRTNQLLRTRATQRRAVAPPGRIDAYKTVEEQALSAPRQAQIRMGSSPRRRTFSPRQLLEIRRSTRRCSMCKRKIQPRRQNQIILLRARRRVRHIDVRELILPS
jgi:hypothetical protein